MSDLFDLLIVGGAAVGGWYYKDKILEFLKLTPGTGGGGNGGGGGVDCTKTPNDPSCTGGGGTGGGGGGGVPTGSTWYKANGTTAKMPRVRCSSGKCGAGSGSTSGGNRWENVMNGWMAKGLEVVAYFTIKSGSMCSGGHVGLKHGGPQHKSCPSSDQRGGACQSSKACCCWWDSGIDNNNQTSYMEIEGSHPSNCRRKYQKKIGVRLDSGKPIGVRWHVSREGRGIRLMQWVDTSGTVNGNKWVETYNILDTGQFMPTDYISKITNQQNIEIRISDAACGDITMHSANSRQITGSTAASIDIPTYIPDRFADLVCPMVPRF